METRQAIWDRRSVRSFFPGALGPGLAQRVCRRGPPVPVLGQFAAFGIHSGHRGQAARGTFPVPEVGRLHRAAVGVPDGGHRPTAYIVVCVRQEDVAPTGSAFDVGAARR